MLDRLFNRGAAAREALAALGKYRVSEETLARLLAYLATAPAADLNLIRAEDLAARLALDEARTLELLAAGVHEGLFDLHWDVFCPGCTGHAADWTNLTQATAALTCPHCDNRFDAHMDTHIAVRFSLNRRYAGVGFRPQPPILRRSDAGTITGLDLLNVQAFRDLLTNQVLPAHESLRVSRLPILFTDLRGSTALYAAKGDPRAYNMVREHFEVLFAAVRAEQGVVVKTLGDSVMASFVAPAGAVRAGLAMQRGLAAFNRARALAPDEALLLKVGIHAGPCIIVTMNGRLDYFGTAVNLASRVEGLSRGGDLVLTDAVLRDGEAAALVEQTMAAGGRLASATVALRGLREPVPVHYLTLPEAASTVSLTAPATGVVMAGL
jgi:class 3 adenylate cyclase